VFSDVVRGDLRSILNNFADSSTRKTEQLKNVSPPDCADTR
jgi:hypothetical protein